MLYGTHFKAVTPGSINCIFITFDMWKFGHPVGLHAVHCLEGANRLIRKGNLGTKTQQ